MDLMEFNCELLITLSVNILPVAVIHSVTETGSIDDRESEIDAILLQQHFASFHGNCLLYPETRSGIFSTVYVCQEHGIDQGGFAETRLTYDNLKFFSMF